MRLFVTTVLAGMLLTAADSQQLAAVRVRAGEDLQAALDRARPGDTIPLEPGAEYVGSFVLPPRASASTAFITIRTSGNGLPAAGARTGPRYSGRLAVIRSNGVGPALRTAPATHHWRIENVEFSANQKGEGQIIALGDDRAQNSMATVPHDIVLDRLYVHGDPQRGQKRGIALNSAATQVINSHISDIKVAGFDGQAICGWNGPGPFLIENNYIEASGENVMFGGADPSIDQLVPSDITIRRNHIARPAAWKAEGWTVKNLLELKNARDVVIEGNLFEHHWPQAQPGHAIVFTPRNQGGKAPWSRVENVRFAGNVVRNVSAGVNISGSDDVRPSERARNIVIENNLFSNIGGEPWGGTGDFVQIGNGPADVRIERNTVLQTGKVLLAYGSRHGLEVTGFVFRGNVLRHNRYGVFGTATGTGNPVLAKFFPGARFEGNVFAGGVASQYPAGNRFVAADALVEETAASRFGAAGAELGALRTAMLAAGVDR